MRLFPAVAAAIVLAATSAAAQGGNANGSTPPPPVYVKNSEVTVLITNAEGHHAELALGYNVLGNQQSIGCDDDRGCLVTVASMVGISDVAGSWAICTLVDGVPANPPCPHQNAASGEDGGVGNGLASVLLAKGRHAIETGVVLNDNAGAHLGNWEVHYTLLEDPPHGHKK